MVVELSKCESMYSNMIIWGKSRKKDTGGNMSSLRANWITEYMRSKVVFFVFTLFAVIMYGESLQFSEVMGDSKNEIVDSLLAVDELSGSIYYQHNYITVDANWQEVDSAIGDYYSWAWMVHFASIGYLSFHVPFIPSGYKLQSATLWIYCYGMLGNSTVGVYPIFNYGESFVFPQGILEHINYGGIFNSNDVIPPTVYDNYILFTHDTILPPCWMSYDVTDCILMDIAENSGLTQYRVYLDCFSDWDNLDDYISIASGSSPMSWVVPKIKFTLVNATSNNDPTNPQPKLIILCYPNPFSDKSTISIKASEPGICKLSIYNLKGQLISSQSSNIYAAEDHTFQWDGRDATGRQVSGGIYIAVVESGRNKVSGRVLYLR